MELTLPTPSQVDELVVLTNLLLVERDSVAFLPAKLLARERYRQHIRHIRALCLEFGIPISGTRELLGTRFGFVVESAAPHSLHIAIDDEV